MLLAKPLGLPVRYTCASIPVRGTLAYKSANYASNCGLEGIYYYQLEVPGSAAMNGWVEVVR